ncbi:MAG: PhnD/SsuA/transferrin family substrate-binding protein, partial [Acidiferrobacterales bacterium]|nr:PhnD/SsuA/transferrin family substrate-binding protein [Acidiferrobacterales bacterium]
MSSTDLQHRLTALRALTGMILSTTLFGSLPASSLITDTPAAAGSVYLMGMQPLGTQIGAAVEVFERPWVFALPPGTSTKRLYTPLIDYLSEVSKHRIIMEHPADWRAYQQGILAGKYDLAFDGAHFASWRITHSRHVPLVRMSTPVRFVVVVSQRDETITGVPELAGRRLCAPPPPDVGTLSLYRHYHNPARRPFLVAVHEREQAYAKMIAGACEAALLPMHVYLQTNHLYARAVFRTLEMPGDTFTAGPRLSTEEKAVLA